MCSYALCPFSHRLFEEADYKATAELFGTKGEEKNLDVFIPKSESDFLEYAEMISHKLKPYEVCLYCLSSLLLFIKHSWHGILKLCIGFCFAEKLSLYCATQSSHETFLDQHEGSRC